MTVQFSIPLKTLQTKGNEAVHTGTPISTYDFAVCQPEVIRLITWLFTEYLHLPIPTEIDADLHGKPKILHGFQPIDAFISLGANRKLFDNDLLFFTPAEQQTINAICATLINARQALLLGYPASGKSMLALTIAKTIQQQGFQAYYASFKYDTQHDLWDDILPLLSHKILFIVDDCHLDIQRAANLYLRHHNVDANACMLFISRHIAEDVQKGVELDFNLFEELRGQTFSSEVSSAQRTDKVTGIITRYQIYFEETHQHSYDTGNVLDVVKKVYADLLLLACYLDVWETKQISLSAIDRAGVLTMSMTSIGKA